MLTVFGTSNAECFYRASKLMILNKITITSSYQIILSRRHDSHFIKQNHLLVYDTENWRTVNVFCVMNAESGTL